MAAIEPNWPALLVYLVAWAVSCVGFFFLSGMLPIRAAPADVRTGAGPALVWFCIGTVLSLIVLTLAFAIGQLRWTSIVVVGGFVFLFAPFFVQDLPRALRDTKAGLLLLLVSAALAVGLVYLRWS